MLSNHNIIKAPAVDDLNDLKKIIRSLEYTSIPFSYVDERRLQDLYDDGKLSKENYKKINNWKIEQGIPLAKGFLQSVVSLSKSLGIISTVKIQKKDLDQPLGFSGPMLNSFINKNLDAVELTEIGHTLCNFLESNENKSMTEYDNFLFWRFLRSNITHNFQKLIEDKNSYIQGIDIVLKNIEMDSRSVNCFLKWASYFELIGIGSKLLIKKKVAKKIIFVTIYELNKLKPGIYSIQKLSNHVSKELDFSNNLIDFFLIFEIILRQIQSSTENKKSIEGTSSSRDELALPHFPKVNMLKINHTIQFDLFIQNVSESELDAVLKIGVTK